MKLLIEQTKSGIHISYSGSKNKTISVLADCIANDEEFNDIIVRAINQAVEIKQEEKK